MTRILLTIVAGLLVMLPGWAKPRQTARVAATDNAEALPVPPIPPDRIDTPGAAPTPDSTLLAPDRPVVSHGVTFGPGLFTPHAHDLSDGFLGKSDEQTQYAKRQRPVPGLQMSVPLH